MTATVIGRSVIGDSHIRKNIECQDSFLIVDKNRIPPGKKVYEDFPDGVSVIAVADGHGSESCPFSKTGSQTAANVFCELMAEYVKKYDGHIDEFFSLLSNEGDVSRFSKRIVKEWDERILSIHRLNKRDVIYDDSGQIDADAILKQYGTTLLGLLITDDFIFAYQLGDGDITFVDSQGATPVIVGDKILGVETHSISKKMSWTKSITRVVNKEIFKKVPFMIAISTDGWSNSHSSEAEYHKTCVDYYNLITEKGIQVVDNNLEGWLSETSKLGCGDDITVVFAYFA